MDALHCTALPAPLFPTPPSTKPAIQVSLLGNLAAHRMGSTGRCASSLKFPDLPHDFSQSEARAHFRYFSCI